MKTLPVQSHNDLVLTSNSRRPGGSHIEGATGPPSQPTPKTRGLRRRSLFLDIPQVDLVHPALVAAIQRRNLYPLADRAGLILEIEGHDGALISSGPCGTIKRVFSEMLRVLAVTKVARYS